MLPREWGVQGFVIYKGINTQYNLVYYMYMYIRFLTEVGILQFLPYHCPLPSWPPLGPHVQSEQHCIPNP